MRGEVEGGWLFEIIHQIRPFLFAINFGQKVGYD